MKILSNGDVSDAIRETLCFDDVLLPPKYSNIQSRSDVDLGRVLGGCRFELPLVSSPMDTVTEHAMAAEMFLCGGLGIIHRYNSIDVQQRHVEKAWESIANGAPDEEGDFDPMIGVAVGVSGDFLERAIACVASGARVLCVDVAHGHHALVKNALQKLKQRFGPSVHIMAGNIATLDAFNDLADWGADSVRVGVGGGSICSTRIHTGHGIPTLQTVMDCAKSDRDVLLIADGGFKTSGDIVKAYAAGADFVMLGSLLAGTDEAPGDIFENLHGERYKAYRGMASQEAQMDWRGSTSSLEGIATTIPYKGTVSFILGDLERGIRSGLSYTGARTLVELQARATFVKQTSAGQVESSTHILRR
jgi:IMP dehydrogenase